MLEEQVKVISKYLGIRTGDALVNRGKGWHRPVRRSGVLDSTRALRAMAGNAIRCKDLHVGLDIAGQINRPLGERTRALSGLGCVMIRVRCSSPCWRGPLRGNCKRVSFQHKTLKVIFAFSVFVFSAILGFVVYLRLIGKAEIFV